MKFRGRSRAARRAALVLARRAARVLARKAALVLALASMASMAQAAPAAAPSPAQTKVLRYALRVAETGFDPAQLSDLYSSAIAVDIDPARRLEARR